MGLVVGSAWSGLRWECLVGLRREWPGGPFASGCPPEGHPLGAEVRDGCADANGWATRPRVRGAPYGSDLGLYAGAGIATPQWGPGHVRVAHSPRGRVSLRDVVEVTRPLVLIVMRSPGVK